MKQSLFQYILYTALGFGLGGMLFGWKVNVTPSSEFFVDPSPYLLEIIIWGFLGGISLSIFSKNIKQIFHTGLLGIAGWIVGGFTGLIVFYLPFFLKHSIAGIFWPLIGATVTIGIIIGIFYALALKIKIWSMALWGAGGFTSGTIVSAIIVGILEEELSLLAGNIITFLIVGVAVGIFLGLGVYFAEKNKVPKNELLNNQTGIATIEFKKFYRTWLYFSPIKWKDWQDGWWKKWDND